MLASYLHPEHSSLAMIKDALHDQSDSEEKLQHLREVLSNNVIVTGWITDPQKINSPENIIASLRQRVEKFETNQHLRELESEVCVVDASADINHPGEAGDCSASNASACDFQPNADLTEA